VLPNLVQAAPSQLAVASVDGRWQLGFQSAVTNAGAAPLLVNASRPSTSVPTMTAYQFAGGKRLGRVGILSYAADPTHGHWHLNPFEDYELRRLGDGALLATVRKEGFCLSDMLPSPGAAPPRHIEPCGLRQPDLLRTSAGISPGWQDVYGPGRQGQYVDVTDVPAGRYLVVNRVNSTRVIRETRYLDNIAAAAIDLAWPEGSTGVPLVTVIGTCAGVTVCATLGVR
jgi:hypothetical protein